MDTTTTKGVWLLRRGDLFVDAARSNYTSNAALAATFDTEEEAARVICAVGEIAVPAQVVVSVTLL